MIPKIVFNYSEIYDEHWKEIAHLNHYFKNIRKGKYPSEKEIKRYMREIEPQWKRVESQILKGIAKNAKLTWQKKYIKVYVVGFALPFSDPLTIPIYPKNNTWFIDVLTHELIHQLFIQKENNKKIQKAWSYFLKRYKKESFNTRIHIPLHAVHYHIYKKLFGKDRNKREIRIMNEYPDYRRSWEIVMQEGPEKILAEWRKRI